tara:strand:- start:22797 stop:23069 length:273 start_codon:yes stop_codon:yes gene_type:complete
MEMRERNSKAYVFSMNPNDTLDRQSLKLFKEMVYSANKDIPKANRKPQRVEIRGRSPKMLSPGENQYSRGGNVKGGIYNASRWDIYLYDR